MSDTLFDQYKAALRRGHMAALAGDLEGALEAYIGASRLVPERALPVASQGTVLHRLDRWAEAAEAFDRALRLAPDDETSLRARATARQQRGLHSGAASDYERLAFVLDVAGRSGDAAAAARLAADLEPSAAREALANRLASAAEHAADLMPAAPAAAGGSDDTAFEAEQPPHEEMSAASAALAAKVAELGTQPDWVDMGERPIRAAGADELEAGHWPPIDLPSLPPPPIEGPPPDPEVLLAEAAALIEAGDTDAACDRMLTAAIVHRAAGRLDAALEVCLQLLTIAPGDPLVHLAIANLQLDRGWTAVAEEKLDLLMRLTALTGDTQAEADVRGLAADRLRDESRSQTTAR